MATRARAGEQWYPGSSTVVEQCALDQDLNDGKTLKKGSLKDFQADNSCDVADFKAIGATLLSKADTAKK